ncbi:aminopeptidase [Granulosicoccaceae sp. 1_MG-2023]|nr:aminopeptidase [Granulosicoccaceae sp. 1_MG-2023]
MMRRGGLAGLAAVFVMLTLAGCSHIAYYSQAVSGHLRLMAAREPVADVLNDPQTEEPLRRGLREAQAIRRFATERLGLPDNDSYRSFVRTGKPYVTWNVVAAPAYSLQPRQWCFPVAGCVSYKGYFAEADAQKEAAALSEQGFDVTVNGATAYSTVGWFDDPLLDTMLRGSQTRLAGLIFHELAHQQLYVAGDSRFNEAFATLVEQEGVRVWLRSQGESERLAEYEAALRRREQFTELLMQARERLIKLYASDLQTAELAGEKAAVFAQLREDYQRLRHSWGGYAGYDRWFARPLNNARLVSVATYRRLLPSFARLFRQQGEDFSAFYAAAAALGKLDKAAREQALMSLPEAQ